MRRWSVLVYVVVAGVLGCVEIQLLLNPEAGDTTPSFNFNTNENDNAGTNGVENENDNAGTNGVENENDNTSTNGVENANDNIADNENVNDNVADNENDNVSTNGVDNENTNDNSASEEEFDIAAINRGEVGDIPPIPDDAEEFETESGLRYFPIEEGFGDSPLPDSVVEVTYSGYLATDGTNFDSGDNVTFSLPNLIQGWQEALAMMIPGDRWRLIIPSELAYGDTGTSGIPPKSTLVFDITYWGLAESN